MMKKIKQIFILITLAILMVPGLAWAAHDSGYALNITRNDMIINEIDSQVSLPFDQEYKVFLKNTTPNGCTVRLFIDNVLVSNMGDFILRAGQELNLERFVGSSLQEGRSFLFVPLGDKRVDDPTRKGNGIVRAEFYPEDIQIYDGIIEIEDEMMPDYFFDEGTYIYNGTNIIDCSDISNISNISIVSVNCTSAGATVEGDMSYQKFSRGHIKVKSNPVILELKIMGLNE